MYRACELFPILSYKNTCFNRKKPKAARNGGSYSVFKQDQITLFSFHFPVRYHIKEMI